jgi:epoxyqueuosine reductase QueG
MEMDMDLKEELKGFAYGLGADLVGFGDVGRCANAPMMMSPQGIFPGAKTVVVMGLHHPDACIELGGERHPQEIGPYSVQYLMNSRLDEMSYRMATFMEEKGFGAIPICSSNIWRYNKYKALDAVFAPDISHIYMPVVAGLADMGYSGLALTPEYGARNRFITVVTDAEIEPDPLIPPGTVCDKCMLCRKHCPSQALSKEIDGEKVLKIENYEYRFANKNLWRCAWGEHFDLDLDLEIPEKVTEEVIVEKVKEHGIRGGEMGQCLKFCVPRKIRGFDRSYSKTPMRRYGVQWDEDVESRKTCDALVAACHGKGVEHVVVHTAASLAEKGFDIGEMLPGAQTAVTLVCSRPVEPGNKRLDYCDGLFSHGIQYLIDSACYDLARSIEEIGFRALAAKGFFSSQFKGRPNPHFNQRLAESIMEGSDRIWYANTVYTRKKFPPRDLKLRERKRMVPAGFRKGADIAGEIRGFAVGLGADMVGVASARRIASVAEQLKPHFEGRRYFRAVDKSHRFKVWEPEIVEDRMHVFDAEDYLPGAKSVIVFGLRYHSKVLEFAAKPPAEAVGPYAFQTYITRWHGTLLASKIAMRLNEMGHRAAITADLMGLGSAIASPRDFIEDLFSNRFAAVAAGLGTLAKSGRVLTPEFGSRQRFMAVVTDAELGEDAISDSIPELCGNCDLCVGACPTAAISSREIGFACDGVEFRFREIDRNLCDWSKRYALSGESGFKYLGSKLDESPEGKVTAAKLAAALKKHDPIKKYRPVACEPCMTACPYSH